VAAISVAGTTSQIGMDRVPMLARQVKRAALGISMRLGYVQKESGAARDDRSSGLCIRETLSKSG
jgi:hypothetical protein